MAPKNAPRKCTGVATTAQTDASLGASPPTAEAYTITALVGDPLDPPDPPDQDVNTSRLAHAPQGTSPDSIESHTYNWDLAQLCILATDGQVAAVEQSVEELKESLSSISRRVNQGFDEITRILRMGGDVNPQPRVPIASRGRIPTPSPHDDIGTAYQVPSPTPLFRTARAYQVPTEDASDPGEEVPPAETPPPHIRDLTPISRSLFAPCAPSKISVKYSSRLDQDAVGLWEGVEDDRIRHRHALLIQCKVNTYSRFNASSAPADPGPGDDGSDPSSDPGPTHGGSAP